MSDSSTTETVETAKTEADVPRPATTQPVGEDVRKFLPSQIISADWLWSQLMAWCKSRGYAPANYNDLFEIVGRVRATPAPETQAGSAGKGVDAQVWTAARDLTAAQRYQPEWLWFRQNDQPTFGRWGKRPEQAPYVRADIALSARPHPVAADRGGIDREAVRNCLVSFVQHTDVTTGFAGHGIDAIDWSRREELIDAICALASSPSVSPRSDLAAVDGWPPNTDYDNEATWPPEGHPLASLFHGGRIFGGDRRERYQRILDYIRQADLAARATGDRETRGTSEDFQARVGGYIATLTADDPTDINERRDRCGEEFLELFQSLGATADGMIALVHYVFGRPKGAPRQEMGGTMVTLAALANATGFDMLACGGDELARCLSPEIMDKVRGKRARRHGRGVLPGVEADLVTKSALPPVPAERTTEPFPVGTSVEKSGGEYLFPGTVVAAFDKLAGQRRYVVEDDRRSLHIFSAANLRVRPPVPADASETQEAQR